MKKGIADIRNGDVADSHRRDEQSYIGDKPISLGASLVFHLVVVTGILAVLLRFW